MFLAHITFMIATEHFRGSMQKFYILGKNEIKYNKCLYIKLTVKVTGIYSVS